MNMGLVSKDTFDRIKYCGECGRALYQYQAHESGKYSQITGDPLYILAKGCPQAQNVQSSHTYIYYELIDG